MTIRSLLSLLRAAGALVLAYSAVLVLLSLYGMAPILAITFIPSLFVIPDLISWSHEIARSAAMEIRASRTARSSLPSAAKRGRPEPQETLRRQLAG